MGEHWRAEIDLNSIHEFKYYRKTSIVFISFVSLAQSNLFCFIFAGLHPLWSFYAPETGSSSETNKNKIVQAQKLSRRGTEHANCTES